VGIHIVTGDGQRATAGAQVVICMSLTWQLSCRLRRILRSDQKTDHDRLGRARPRLSHPSPGEFPHAGLDPSKL